MVSDEKCAVVGVVFFPVGKVSFFSGCFQDFFRLFVLRSLIMMCLGMNVFRFLLGRIWLP